MTYDVVEICAGAGGQALGLERAGFAHALAVELDRHASETLKANRPGWNVATGDVVAPEVWDPRDYEGVSLLAGGVPCPPFSIAGKQLGAADERDLFAWAVELAIRVKPRALLLENVRGLSMPRFAAYRQAVLDRLAGAGYVADWRLLQSSDFGVPQLRPRFVLVALQEDAAPRFQWPSPVGAPRSVGETLRDLMAVNNWEWADTWADEVTGVAPTIVGGSKKHGGADLGPTRAKRSWRAMHVDGMGIADAAPLQGAPHFRTKPPRLTVEMVARLQGWDEESQWHFAGRKTAQYRQVGNAFPPPLAEAVGRSIAAALNEKTPVLNGARRAAEIEIHDDVYRVLRETDGYLDETQILDRLDRGYTADELLVRIDNLKKDFDIETRSKGSQVEYRLGEFRAFRGQDNHHRHLAFSEPASRSRIS